MDKQKKDGNIKKSNLYLPTARRWARTVGARDGGLRERLATRDGGGRWGTVGDSGEGWETVGKKGGRLRSERE